MNRLNRRTAPIVLASMLLALVPGMQKASGAPLERPVPSSGATHSRVAAPLAVPRLQRSFLQPTSDYSAGHRGVDYQVGFQEEVLAPTDGYVWFAGKVVDRELVTIKSTAGALLSMEPVCATVKTGDVVSIGAVIGAVCDADQPYRQHCPDMRCLHFSYRIETGYLSPVWVMGQLAPSRLLPWSEV